jgi:Mg-chelatase subunit ChlD
MKSIKRTLSGIFILLFLISCTPTQDQIIGNDQKDSTVDKTQGSPFQYSIRPHTADTITGFGMGSSTHYRVDDVAHAYGEIKSMGVIYIREEFPIEDCQLGFNKYTFRPPEKDYDRAVELANQYDLEIVALLTYGPKLHQSEDEFFELWRNYVLTLVERYGEDINYWQIGNEMNSLGMWEKVRRDATHVEVNVYARMLEIAYDVIKAADPEDVVILGGLINDTNFTNGYSPLDFIKALLNTSNKINFDALGLHTYWGENMPEDVRPQHVVGDRHPFTMNDYVIDFSSKTTEIIGSEFPIWITEVGYDDDKDLSIMKQRYNLSVDDLQAIALSRTYPTLLSIPQVEAVFWYTYENDDTGQKYSLKDKSKKALQTLTEAITYSTPLGGFQIVNNEQIPLQDTYEFRFMRADGDTASIYWKNSPNLNPLSIKVENLKEIPAYRYQLAAGVNFFTRISEDGSNPFDLAETPNLLIGKMDSDTQLVLYSKANVIDEASSSATVFLLDTSGSMNEQDITGYSKIEAAQRATQSILDVIKTENMSALSYLNQVGMVSFDNTPTLGVNLTTDLPSVESGIDRLSAFGGTGMADGLRMAIDMLSPVDPSFNKMAILLSDGMPNVGLNSSNNLNESEIIEELTNLTSEAKSSGICVHTIGFGLPGQIGGVSGEDSINEELLKRIASESGCGNYYNARNAIELANAFIEIRHASLGQILFSQQGVISQNEDLDLGTVPVADNQELILITLNWPGSQLDLELTDPAGVLVDSNYPNANVNTTSSLVSMAVTEPMAGNWRVKVFGADVPESQTDYKVLFSARAKPEPAIELEATQTDNVIPAPSGLTAILVLVLITVSAILVTKYSGAKRKDPVVKATPQAYLISQSTNAQHNMIPLSNNFIIGRRSTANLHLDSMEISRDHAQIYYSGGKWYIHDMNSRLGTYVNGHAVKIAPLSPGEKIKIGKYEWIFHITT